MRQGTRSDEEGDGRPCVGHAGLGPSMWWNKLKKESVESLVARYAAAAAVHGQTTGTEDYRTGNRAADSIIAICRELRRRGPDAQRQLLPLLTHPDPGVRCWAGAHALEFAPAEGERALLQLTALPNTTDFNRLRAFAAEMALREWRAGRLRFP